MHGKLTENGAVVKRAATVGVSLFRAKIALRSLQVQLNGIVELEEWKLKTFQNGPFPIENTIFIAPFYANIGQTGIVFYDVIKRSDSNSNAAQDEIRNFTNCDSFSPDYVIVATWICVGYRGQQQNDSVSIIIS